MSNYDSNHISITKIEYTILYGYVLRIYLQHKRQFSGGLAIIETMSLVSDSASAGQLMPGEIKIILPPRSTNIRAELPIKRGVVSVEKLQQIILRCLKTTFYNLGRWGYVVSPKPSMELVLAAPVDVGLDEELP